VFLRPRLRRALLAALLAPLASPAAEPVRDFDVPAGSLAGALAVAASAAGVLLAADARLTAGKASAGLHGRHGAREALELLLAGSGLELVALDQGYGLRVRPAAATRSPDAQPSVLPLTRVHAAPEEDAYLAEDIVAATHTPARVHEVPQSVAVVTRAMIDDAGLQGMADVARFVPGVGAAQGEGNRDTLVYRGNSSTADFLFDGLRDDAQYFRDLYNVERVEALNGPNAALLGAGSAGGAMNRVSKAPDAEPHAELRLQADAWSQRRATLDWSPAAEGAWGLRVNALAENAAGYRDTFWLRRLGLNPVVAWHDGTTRATLGVEHFEDERRADRGVPSYQGRPLATDPGAFFGDPAQSRSSMRLDAVDLKLDRTLAPGTTLRSQTRVALYDKFFQNAFAAGAATLVDGQLQVALTAHNSLTRRRNVDSRVELVTSLAQGAWRHELVAGADLGWRSADYGRQTGYFDAAGQSTSASVTVAAPQWDGAMSFRRTATDPDSYSVATAAGVYLQDQLRFSERWSALLGLRHDHLAVRLDDHRPVAPAAVVESRDTPWSPRAALVFAPLPALSLYASWSLGYVLRAGDQLASLTPTNAALSPERFRNRELGAKWTIAPGLEATAAAYVLDRENVAVASGTSATDLALVDGQRSRGLEVAVGGELSARWRATLAYALQDSRLRSALSTMAPADAQMPHVPRHSLSLWARGQVDAQWSAALGITARSAMYAGSDNLVVLPGYARFDAGLFFDPSPGTRVQLNVENLFDRRYWAFAQSDNNITPGSPRAWRVTLVQRF
jgi:catecholate siderophore receptor